MRRAAKYDRLVRRLDERERGFGACGSGLGHHLDAVLREKSSTSAHDI